MPEQFPALNAPHRMMQRAVFLDRDGVINRAVIRNGKPYPPDTLAELEILPDVPAALAQLKAAGFVLVVVTNQPDVARGKQTRAAVEAMHTALAAQLPLDNFQVCYHDDADDCPCRKPKPGMLHNAARALQLNIAASYMVGDRWRDVAAGRSAGCTTILIDYRYQEPETAAPDFRAHSLAAAAAWIVRHAQENP